MAEFRFSLGEYDEKGPVKELTVSFVPVPDSDMHQPVVTTINRETGFEATVKLPKGKYAGLRERIVKMAELDPESAGNFAKKVVALLSFIR